MKPGKSKIPPHAKRVFEGVIYEIYQWQQEMFDGSIETFEVARRADVVSVIPVVDDQILILHEEQPHHGSRISFPGGRIEPGEDPFTAAHRELREETGMKFGKLKLVMIEDIGGGKLDWTAYRFVATDLIATEEQQQDPGERIQPELVSFSKAKEYSVGNLFMSLEVMSQVESLEALLALPAVELPEAG